MSSIKPYLPVLKFVGIFAGIYIILLGLYEVYKSADYTGDQFPDPITAQVSKHTSQVLKLFNYDVFTVNSPNHPSVQLHINGELRYLIIEGCNAVSVIILFCAFVLAFAKAWKKTILFLLMGIVTIYIVNVLRLVILGIIYTDYLDYKKVAHDFIFPAIIYGYVVILWLLWIRKPKSARVE